MSQSHGHIPSSAPWGWLDLETLEQDVMTSFLLWEESNDGIRGEDYSCCTTYRAFSCSIVHCTLYVVLPRDVLATRWEEFSVKWDGMLDWAALVPQALLLDFRFLPPFLGAASLDFPHLSSACFLSQCPPGENVLFILWIFFWLSYLWAKPCRNLADLNITWWSLSLNPPVELTLVFREASAPPEAPLPTWFTPIKCSGFAFIRGFECKN